MHLCVQYNYDFCYLLCFLFFLLKTLGMFNEQFTIEGMKGSVGVLTYRKSQKQERIKKNNNFFFFYVCALGQKVTL